MDDQQKMERLKKLIAEERSECISPVWWYLSFAGEPDGWRGGVIVLAHGFATALLEATRLKINPHGEVYGHPVPKDHIPDRRFRNRLLTKAELEEFWGPMVRFRSGGDNDIILEEED
jgi:hypothetical protein